MKIPKHFISDFLFDSTDKQQNKVYQWEQSIVAPLDQTLVKFIWEQEKLKYPPQVILLPNITPSWIIGDATRTTVRFQSSVNTWIILHELAHSMTSQSSGLTNKHGALFVGVYCKLLKKYITKNGPHKNVDFVKSAREFGLQVRENAEVVF